MRVALYARVSTVDKDQRPENQLIAMREYCEQHGWEIYREYIDKASALDMRGRKAWRDLQQDAGRRKFGAILVWKLDRAFRSGKHMHDSLDLWQKVGIEFLSMKDQVDTTTPMGRFMVGILALISELELGTTAERVKLGIHAARMQGKQIGRPGGTNAKGFADQWEVVRPSIQRGDLSISKASAQLGVARSTIRRLLAQSEVNVGVAKRGQDSEAENGSTKPLH